MNLKLIDSSSLRVEKENYCKIGDSYLSIYSYGYINANLIDTPSLSDYINKNYCRLGNNYLSIYVDNRTRFNAVDNLVHLRQYIWRHICQK